MTQLVICIPPWIPQTPKWFLNLYTSSFIICASNSMSFDKSIVYLSILMVSNRIRQYCTVQWQSTPLFLPRKSLRQGSLVGYSPWSCKRVKHDWATGLTQMLYKYMCFPNKSFVFSQNHFFFRELAFNFNKVFYPEAQYQIQSHIDFFLVFYARKFMFSFYL